MEYVLNLVRSTRTVALVALSLAMAWPGAAAAQGVTTGALNGIVTNQQDQINTNLYGEVLPVRREFQRPSTYRALFGVSF